jgi:glucokinase
MGVPGVTGSAGAPDSTGAPGASGTGTTARYFVGVDIGGTGIKAGLFDADLGMRLEFRIPTPRSSGPDEVVAAVLDAVRDAATRGERLFGAGPAAVGLAVLGLIDEPAGVAISSAAVGWRDVPLRGLVEEAAGVPVGFGHDLRAAALAEARLGAGQGLDSFMFVALGTGIGAAVMLDGEPLSGAHGRAGEIGHIAVAGHADPCGCGGHGCLETVASARAIAARYARRTGAVPPVSAAEVARLVRLHDPDAVTVWAEAVDALSEVLAGCVTALDPGSVVLGGGLALSGELLLAPLRSALASRVTLGPPPPVTVTALGDNAALVGAGLLAKRSLEGKGRQC